MKMKYFKKQYILKILLCFFKPLLQNILVNVNSDIARRNIEIQTVGRFTVPLRRKSVLSSALLSFHQQPASFLFCHLFLWSL